MYTLSLWYIAGGGGGPGLDDVHEGRGGDAVPVELPEPSGSKRSCDGLHGALVVELPLPAEGQGGRLCLLTVLGWIQTLVCVCVRGGGGGGGGGGGIDMKCPVRGLRGHPML